MHLKKERTVAVHTFGFCSLLLLPLVPQLFSGEKLTQTLYFVAPQDKQQQQQQPQPPQPDASPKARPASASVGKLVLELYLASKLPVGEVIWR